MAKVEALWLSNVKSFQYIRNNFIPINNLRNIVLNSLMDRMELWLVGMSSGACH